MQIYFNINNHGYSFGIKTILLMLLLLQLHLYRIIGNGNNNTSLTLEGILLLQLCNHQTIILHFQPAFCQQVPYRTL